VAESTLTRQQAEVIWSILEEVCGASESDRRYFIDRQTSEHIAEWRFIGSLGFGGKFWRSTGQRPDGTWGELWHVNCYREDQNDARRVVIAEANSRLWAVQLAGLLRDDNPYRLRPRAGEER
jgi:hypothetical protein